jgi:hypothetical protein
VVPHRVLEQNRGLLDERRIRVDAAERSEGRVEGGICEREAWQPGDRRTVGPE